MKKAKIMLSGIALLAIVGGALAFTINHNVTPIWYTLSTRAGLGTCMLQTSGFDLTSTNINSGVTVYYTFAPNLNRNNCTNAAKLVFNPN
jgi:hypothetical protein